MVLQGMFRHSKAAESTAEGIMKEKKPWKSKILPQMLAASSGTLMLMNAGFHYAWSSPSLPKILEDVSVPVTIAQSSWIVSFVMIGGVSGPLIGLGMVDTLGRKTTILLLSIPLLLSCCFIAFAQYYWWYYIARFVGGMGLGTAHMVVPMYVGEIAEDRIRGSLGILSTVMLNTGLLLPSVIGPWVSIPALAGAGAIIPIVCFLTFIWMPETPHYYIMKDQPDKARKSLEWLRGTKNVDRELEMVKNNVETDLKNPGTLKELFTDKGNRKALIIAIGLFTAQQVSGTVAITAYSTMMFNAVASNLSSSVSVIISGLVQFVVSILVIFLCDRKGRRTLLLVSMFFSIIFLIGEGVYFHLKYNEIDVSKISWLPVTSMIGYLCSYSLGLGTVPPIVIAEMFSCNVKAYATTISTMYLTISAGVVSQLYPIVVNTLGIHFAFYGFAIGTCILMIITYFYLPETKGKSFSEIQDILRGRESSKI